MCVSPPETFSESNVEKHYPLPKDLNIPVIFLPGCICEIHRGTGGHFRSTQIYGSKSEQLQNTILQQDI